MASIVFTDDAVDDLRRLGPSVAPRVLKKILLLETDPRAGQPLGGELTAYRKLVVGDRQWRVVYRVDDAGDVEICELWAVGTRAGTAVYAEASKRVRDAAERDARLLPLVEAIERLGRLAGGVTRPAAEEPPPVPDWLAERLIGTVGMNRAEVAALDAEAAFERWNRWITGQG